MRLLAFIFSVVLSASAQDAGGTGRYPEVRAFLREAESIAATIVPPKDRHESAGSLASLYAQAGYLDDSARAFANVSDPPYALWKARVVYGDLAGAEKSVQAIADPERRAGMVAVIANLLWRMGEPAKARMHFESAKERAGMIADPVHRRQVLTEVEQGLRYVDEAPPYLLSATPKPEKRFDVQDSPIPLFPMTPGGFRYWTTEEMAARKTDGVFLQQIYERIDAKDPEGLGRVA